MWQVVSHEALLGLWQGYADPAAWLVLIWSAVGPGALAAFLQTQVSPPCPCNRSALTCNPPFSSNAILLQRPGVGHQGRGIGPALGLSGWQACVDGCMQGQKRVPAAQAQIIFSSLPLWSALFAALLLRGEVMGASGWLGGSLITCAGIIASRKG